jgi:6-pyruvoyltetrahydropterin/6-carboxytetrahydropterin synthase
MYTIAKRFAFSASHVIGGLPTDHPAPGCTATTTRSRSLQSPTLDGVGFARDFYELSALRDLINATLDQASQRRTRPRPDHQ